MDTTLNRIVELRETLDALASALAGARSEELLALEARLAAIVAALPLEPPQEDEAREAAREELARARQALTACRRLGANLQQFVRWSAEWMMVAPQYDAQGLASGASGGAALNVRG